MVKLIAEVQAEVDYIQSATQESIYYEIETYGSTDIEPLSEEDALADLYERWEDSDKTDDYLTREGVRNVRLALIEYGHYRPIEQAELDKSRIWSSRTGRITKAKCEFRINGVMYVHRSF